MLKLVVLILLTIGSFESEVRPPWKYGCKHRIHKTRKSKTGNCPDITSFRNGEVSIEGLSVGHSATFSCNENYTYCGENSIVCKYDLKWHRPSPLCVPLCFSGNYTFTYRNSSYFISGFKLNFYDSQNYCKSLEGNLLMIDSREEQDLISCVLTTLNNNDKETNQCGIARKPLWHGVTKKDEKWQFVNGENITEFFWGDREPDLGDSCSDLHRSLGYRWNSHIPDRCFSDNNFFVCEVNA